MICERGFMLSEQLLINLNSSKAGAGIVKVAATDWKPGQENDESFLLIE